MDSIDVAITWILIFFTIVCIVLLLMPLQKMHEIAGNIFVVLTHAMVIPVYVHFSQDHWYTSHGQWYVAIVTNSLVASLVYHICKIVDVLAIEATHWDISAQNFLLLATLVILVDEDNVPSSLGYVAISLSAIFVASFGEVYALGFKVFEWAALLIFIVLTFYVIKRTIYPVQKREKSYLHVASALVVAAGITFALSTSTVKDRVHEDFSQHLDNTYGIIHSMWHVYAYSMLYFALKALVRHPREFSTLNDTFDEMIISS